MYIIISRVGRNTRNKLTEYESIVNVKRSTPDLDFGIQFCFLSSYSLLALIFEIFDLMLSDWVSFLAYPNLFGIKGFVVVVVVVVVVVFHFHHKELILGLLVYCEGTRKCGFS
jgi:NADH:ubiquinone oxidoreductase subunit 3 (subunit A)